MTQEEPMLEPAGEDRAFHELARLVRDWRLEGRTTTTAGLKPALDDALAGRPHAPNFGYSSFREFVSAAEIAGHVRLVRSESGHWIVMLPDEDPATIPGMRIHGDATHLRLKATTWSAFVEWGEDLKRLWDTQRQTPVVFPVTGDGSPAWESDPGRFVTISPANQETQTQWMHEWATSLPDSASLPISASLDPNAPPGAFARAVSEQGLGSEWRDELQRRVIEHARAWATSNGVPETHLVDARRRRNLPRKPAHLSEKNAPKREWDDASRRVGTSTALDDARDRLHKYIDRMTLTEVLELPVPLRVVLEDLE